MPFKQSLRLLKLLLCLGLTACYTLHQPDPDLDFETRLIAFKHELYPLLTRPVSDSNVLGPVRQRIQAFTEAHASELQAYREARLRRVGRFQVNLSDFVEEPLKDLNPTLAERNQQMQAALALMDPMAQIYQFIPVVLMQKGLTASQVGNFYFQASVASPLFQASPLGQGDWEVLADYYSQAFRFVYHNRTGVMELKNCYRRKP